MLSDKLELNKIYCCDCLELMAKMPDGFIDLTVTSPPYDGLRDYNGYSFRFEEIAKQLFRTLKQGGVCVWVVGDSCEDGDESGTCFKQALYFKQIGFKLFDTMIYHKYGTPMRGNLLGYNQVFEYMFVFTKGKILKSNIIKDRPNATSGASRITTNRKSDGKINNQGVCKTEDFGRRENIWSYTNGFMQTAKDTIAFNHPAIFPEQLCGDHIKSWSNDGDLIFDPFMGSGTTAKMAILLNRKYIGSDISQEYVDLANERIKPYLEQGNLFARQDAEPNRADN